MSHPIPRSDFQYKWIKDTVKSDYNLYSGQQEVYGHAPKNGMILTVGGEYESAITWPMSASLPPEIEP